MPLFDKNLTTPEAAEKNIQRLFLYACFKIGWKGLFVIMLFIGATGVVANDWHYWRSLLSVENVAKFKQMQIDIKKSQEHIEELQAWNVSQNKKFSEMSSAVAVLQVQIKKQQ